jgi:hypothetical protein
MLSFISNRLVGGFVVGICILAVQSLGFAPELLSRRVNRGALIRSLLLRLVLCLLFWPLILGILVDRCVLRGEWPEERYDFDDPGDADEDDDSAPTRNRRPSCA